MVLRHRDRGTKLNFERNHKDQVIFEKKKKNCCRGHFSAKTGLNFEETIFYRYLTRDFCSALPYFITEDTSGGSP